MSRSASAWRALLSRLAPSFSAPSFVPLSDLVSAWALTTARRSIVSMVGVMDPALRSAHDAYHRLVRAGAWSLSALFETLVLLAVRVRAPRGGMEISIPVDMRLHRKNGTTATGRSRSGTSP